MRIYPKDFNVNDIIWECASDRNAKIKVLTEPIVDKNGFWRFTGLVLNTNSDNQTINYFTKNNSAYACRFYTEPQYV